MGVKQFKDSRIGQGAADVAGMNSKAFSHYRLLKKLGEGGMGEAYLAEDTSLNRKVAIKFLPERLGADDLSRRRLLKEAQAAARLDHPNICAVHEVSEEAGRIFIVMQYVEGETLASRIDNRRLEFGEILDIAVQVADALAEAHSRGIIHRDIKPQNILITARNQAKVLDFGLAKMVPDRLSTDSDAETCSLLSSPGLIVGTVPYMSPEQVRGEPVDERSDLFSFGAVLYEMMSGRRPFEMESPAETISAILTRDPPPLDRYVHDVPAELQRILLKTLAKDKQERYQSARDLFLDLGNLRRELDVGPRVVTTEAARRRRLRRLVSSFLLAAIVLLGVGLSYLVHRQNASDRVIDSIAVLPLVNASADTNAEYLSDGITENIINNLSQLPQLRVMARTTVFRYKGREVDSQSIGRDLGVRAVVTGRVLQVGDTLDIQTELVDASTGSQLWGQRYNRKIGDIFAVQEEIAREISEKLRLRFGDRDKQRLAKRHTDNAKAYELYMKGRYHLSQWTQSGFTKGVGYLNQAIATEPGFALAYAALAQAYSIGVFSSPRETAQAAKDAANKALEIDETLADAHTSMAIARMYLDWDWSGAEREFNRAIELNSGDASAHHWYGWYLGLMGRFDESFAELKLAESLDPLSLVITSAIGITSDWAGQYDRSIQHHQKALDLEPNRPGPRLSLAESYARSGRFSEALAEYERLRNLLDRSPTTQWRIGLLLAMCGKTHESRNILNDIKEGSGKGYVPPYLVAAIYTSLGEKDKAFEWFEQAYEERSALMAFLKVDPSLKTIRGDARFADLLRRVGFAN